MSQARSAARNRAEYLLYLAAVALVERLGPRGTWALGRLLGDLYLSLGRSRRQVLEYNLRLAFPEAAPTAREALARAVARHFGRASLDALRLRHLGPEQLMRDVEVIGRPHLDAALSRGGALVMSAHIGSWEVAALVAGLLVPSGFAMVNRPLDNPLLERELLALRGRFGNRSLGKGRVVRELLRHIARGGAAGLVVDQRPLQSEGVLAPFFGHPAFSHPILARLARRTGTPVVPVWCFMDGPARYTVRFDQPLRVSDLAPKDREDAALCSRFNAMVEAVIRERAEQWLWFHDRWRHLRQGAR